MRGIFQLEKFTPQPVFLPSGRGLGAAGNAVSRAILSFRVRFVRGGVI